MPRITADEFVEKHARRLKAASEDIRRGIERTTENPMMKAVQKKEKMRAGIMEALDNGKWEKGLKRVSLEDWKNKTANVGIGRISAGIDAAAPKVRSFAAEVLPHIAAGQAAIERLPDVTLEDSIQRMSTFIRHMAKFERKG